MTVESEESGLPTTRSMGRFLPTACKALHVSVLNFAHRHDRVREVGSLNRRHSAAGVFTRSPAQPTALRPVGMPPGPCSPPCHEWLQAVARRGADAPGGVQLCCNFFVGSPQKCRLCCHRVEGREPRSGAILSYDRRTWSLAKHGHEGGPMHGCPRASTA